MLLGSRVVRGPDWKGNEHEDDSEGLVGTIVSVKEYEEGRPLHRRTVKVRWDNGYESNYTVGADGNHDLRVVELSSNAGGAYLEDFANVEKKPWEKMLETFWDAKSDSENVPEKQVKTDLQKLAEKLVKQNQRAVFQTENSFPVEDPVKVEGLPPEQGSICAGFQADRPDGCTSEVRNKICPGYCRDNPDSSDVYRMKSNPRGLMIIINIRKFVVDPSLPDHEKLQKDLVERKGSEKDVYDLSNLFGGYLQFDVHILETEEKTRYQLLEELRFIANKPEYKEYDCFALCIMSHGKGSEFYNYDGRTIKTSAVFNMFSNSACENYRGKPKLFFIQACRGQLGRGRPHAEIDGPTEERSVESYDNDMADMLLAYSSFEDYASFRHSKEGSFFIQSLVSVFREYADKEHILDLMTKVTYQVHSRIHGSFGGLTQVPAPIPTLRKKLYFWPGKNFYEESY